MQYPSAHLIVGRVLEVRVVPAPDALWPSQLQPLPTSWVGQMDTQVVPESAVPQHPRCDAVQHVDPPLRDGVLEQVHLHGAWLSPTEDAFLSSF